MHKEFMDKYILACAGGMSTSILARKMQNEAVTRGLDIEIEAISESNVKEELNRNSDRIKAILLGPQIRYIKQQVANMAAPFNVPVDVIDMMDYGTVNGPKVLDHALSLANQ